MIFNIPRSGQRLRTTAPWYFLIENTGFNRDFIEKVGLAAMPDYASKLELMQNCFGSSIQVKRHLDPVTNLSYDQDEIVDHAIFRKGMTTLRDIRNHVFSGAFIPGVELEVIDIEIRPKRPHYATIRIFFPPENSAGAEGVFRTPIDTLSGLQAEIIGETLRK